MSEIPDCYQSIYQELAKRLSPKDMQGGIVLALRKDGTGRAFGGEAGCRAFNPPALPIKKIFSVRQDVGTIVFVSARFCKEMALANKMIPPVLDDTAQILGTNVMVCTDAAQAAHSLKKKNACLINYGGLAGVLAVGHTALQAVAAVLIAEKSAQAAIEGELIGGARPLSGALAALMHLVYQNSYAKMDGEAVAQTSASFQRIIPDYEMRLREAIVECGKKLSSENLIQGTWGNISVRLDDKYMLATPSGLVYERLTAYDIVRIEINTLEYEGTLKPTSEKGLHAALLRVKSDVGCVIHTHPVNCSVFAAAQKPVPVTDAATALLGKEVVYAKKAIPGTKALIKAVIEAMGPCHSGCIMGNHGIILSGKDINDTIQKCRAMEYAARIYLDSLKNNRY